MSSANDRQRTTAKLAIMNYGGASTLHPNDLADLIAIIVKAMDSERQLTLEEVEELFEKKDRNSGGWIRWGTAAIEVATLKPPSPTGETTPHEQG